MAALLPHIGVATIVTPPLVYGATKLQDYVHETLKRKYPDSPWTNPKRLKLSPAVIRRRPKMAFRRRRFRRRRTFRKRRTGFRRSMPRRSFARRVKRVMLRTIEPQKIDNITSQDLVLQEGDGTSRIVYVMNPAMALANSPNEGLESKITGNQFWLKGFSVRGSLHMDVTTPAATSCLVRITLIKHKENAQSMAVGWVPYGNTTTDILAPVQVPPFFNPRFFETTGNQAFTGDGYIIPFDKTKCKVIKSYTIAVNPAGDVEGTQFSMPTPFNLWFPVNRKMQFIDPIEGGITQDTLGFKHGSYYLVMQVIASAAGTQSDNVAVMAHRVSTYFRDI